MRNLLALALIALLVFTSPAQAGWTPIAHNAKGSTTSTQTTITTTAINDTGADLDVVVASVFNTTTAVITDSAIGNVWTQAVTSGVGANALNVIVFYCQSPVTSTTHTFTLTTAGTSFPAISVDAFSGSTTSPKDQTNHNQTTSAATLQPGSITPLQNNELVYNAISFNTTTAASINAGTITNNLVAAGGVHDGLSTAYNIQTTATASNPTWTVAASSTATADQVSFFAATVAPTTASFLFGFP